MKNSIIWLLFLSFLLCGCAASNATVTTTTVPTTTEHTQATVTTTVYNPLQSWSDLELLEKIASDRNCNYWKFSAVADVKFGLYGLKRICPEFAELLTRDTAVESIKAYANELNKEYEGCGINQLLWILDDIEAYISRNSG